MKSGVGLGPKVVRAISHALSQMPNHNAAPDHIRSRAAAQVERPASVRCRSDLGAAASSIVIDARSPSAPRLIVDNRLDHCDIHVRTERNPRYSGRHLRAANAKVHTARPARRP